MDAANSQCPKCEGQMESGFLFDRSLASSRLLHWVEGEPERGISGSWKTSGKRTNEISRAERCGHCGFLEYYTSKEVQYV